MNQHLQNILDLLQQIESISDDQKALISKSLKDADKELVILAFKLDRTEKVKRTTAILLEETIEELEQKRKAVEVKNHELEIESSLERVRTVAMGMNKPDDMVNVCHVISDQLQLLGLKDIRNVQTAIIHEQKGTYLNYQYFAAYKEGVIEETDYNHHPTVFSMAEEMKKSANSSFSGSMEGTELNTFREWRKQNNQLPDPVLDEVDSAHYYFYSIGLGGLGLTTYRPLPEEGLEIFKRFHNVFTLAYRRFTDIELALELAEQAEIDLIKLKEEKRRTEEALTELKATQSQLIQSEKMASLGELTAGIAHEIQNPLNFVNNFSEVSSELLEELNEEFEKGDLEEVKFILKDIKQNLEKINHHGKRADAIVKGMLQHSRTSTGQKEPTDINALADEYLRLSYHGLRAKDKSFNSDFKTDFDPNLPKVNVIPQDIGRVLLNLINNAFYACAERGRSAVHEKTLSGYDPARAGLTGLEENYKPTVIVSTKNLGDRIEISVKDNGNGIPEEIKNKIFQPFFTTKPTGQGTGLGLSLAYDIVKAHGGELKVETKEGGGSIFTIQLPIS